MEIIEAVASRLADEDAAVRAGAAEALGRFGTVTANAIDALTDALRDDSPTVRANAAEALGLLRSPSVKVIARLGTMLCDEDPVVRARAAQAIGRIGDGTLEITAACLELLQTDVGCVRMYAAEALGATAMATTEVVAGLSAALRDKNWNVRSRAVAALGRLEVAPPGILETLIRMAREEPAWVRIGVAKVLVGYAATDVPAAEEMIRLLSDSYFEVGSSALNALNRLEGGSEPTGDVLERLSGWLAVDSPRARIPAALLWAKLNERTESFPVEVRNGLELALREGRWNERLEAARILHRRFPGERELYVRLLDTLEYSEVGAVFFAENWEELADFVKLLQSLGVGKGEILKRAFHTAVNPNWRVRARAINLFGVLQFRTAEVTASLLQTLGDKAPELRRNAANALGRIGMPTAEVVASLQALLSDREPEVREAAKEALNSFPVEILESFISPLQTTPLEKMNLE